MEIGFFAAMIAVFVSYIGMVWYKFGVLPSISESFYRFSGNNKWYFTLFCWGIAFPAIIIGSTPLMFLAGMGIAFVGAATMFKEKLTGAVHFTGAAIGIIASQLAIYFDFNQPIINYGAITVMVLIFTSKNIIKNYIWWIEIVAFMSIILALFLKI